MSAESRRKDLVLLVADKPMEVSLRGLLSRVESLGIRRVVFDLFVHPDRDPGCLRRAQDFLRPFVSQYERALVLLDHHGCGREEERSVLEVDLERRLGEAGWEDRAAAVIIAPELENWVWSDSPRVDRALGWGRDAGPLKDWLRDRDLWEAGAAKPSRPKEAVKLVLWTVRRPYSSSILLELAQNVGIDRCTDPAFLKLKRCLREWFPAPV